ncbi:hypothetical protein BRADO2933 [Bradyrhizobium sp. ORS 278]|nr:hypothetical protein BRADO2933 [Bradyrhizobium sp. ORS 278]
MPIDRGTFRALGDSRSASVPYNGRLAHVFRDVTMSRQIPSVRTSTQTGRDGRIEALPRQPGWLKQSIS